MRRTTEVVQLSFPFAWEAIDLMRLADKKSIVRRDKWGPITLHRSTGYSIWVISKWIPIIGPSGYIGGSMLYVFPDLFFRGGDARRVAQSSYMTDGVPFVDNTIQ